MQEIKKNRYNIYHAWKEIIYTINNKLIDLQVRHGFDTIELIVLGIDDKAFTRYTFKNAIHSDNSKIFEKKCKFMEKSMQKKSTKIDSIEYPNYY